MSKEILDKAKEAVKGKWWKITGITLLLLVVINIIITALLTINLASYAIFDDKGLFISLIPCTLIGIYLLSAVSLGFTKYFYALTKKEEKFTLLFYGFKDVKMMVKYWGSGFTIIGVALVIELISALIGKGLLLIPGVSSYVIPVFDVYLIPMLVHMIINLLFAIFFTYYMVFMYPLLEGDGPIRSLRESRKLVKGHLWSLLWAPIRLMLIPIILDIAGYILMFIGTYGIYKQTVIYSLTKIASVSKTVQSTIITVIAGLVLLTALGFKIWLNPRRVTLYPSAYKVLKDKKEKETIE